jgi:hypoxanthine phosphoribosyltransferase
MTDKPTQAQDAPSVLIDAGALQQRVAALGAQITTDYAGAELVVVPVLMGSFIFAADLVRAVGLPLTLDFLAVRSYGDATLSSGIVQLTQDLSRSIEGKHVLLVEDIVDTGLTIDFLLTSMASRGARSVKLASLLHKPARSKRVVNIDYLGFTIEDVFVVGYGLDHAQRFRNLPYVGVLPMAAANSEGQ